MLIKNTGVVGSKGSYGPFSDGRQIPYIDWVDGDGGGVFRATVGEGVVPPDALTQGEATFELRRKDDGKLTLRVVHFQPSLLDLDRAA